jgi:hypothetical protein
MVLDSTILNEVQVIRAAEYIVIDIILSLSTLLQYILSLVSPIRHIFGHLRVLPTSLELWAEGKRRKHLPRDLLLTTRVPELFLVITRLTATRAFFQVSKGTRECDAGVDAHVVLPGVHSR